MTGARCGDVYEWIVYVEDAGCARSDLRRVVVSVTARTGAVHRWSRSGIREACSGDSGTTNTYATPASRGGVSRIRGAPRGRRRMRRFRRPCNRLAARAGEWPLQSLPGPDAEMPTNGSCTCGCRKCTKRFWVASCFQSTTCGNHRVDDEDIVFSTALRRKGEASAAGGVCHGATKRQSSAAFSSAAFVSRGTARSPSSCRSVAACAAVPLAMSA